MQPIQNSAWFAKMKATLKVLEADERLIEKNILSTGFCGILSTRVNSRYLKQFLLNEKFNIIKDSKTEGTTQEAINNENTAKIEIIFPKDLKEQEKIVVILETIDNNINKTKALIEKLQKMKQGLMQNMIDYQSKNWNKDTLGNLGTFKNGINKDKESFGFGTKFVNIENAYPDDLDNINLGRLNANFQEVNEYKLQEGDIIFVRSSVKPTGVGYNTLFRGDEEDVVFCGFMIRYRLHDKSNNNPDFFNYYFRNKEFRKRLLALSTVSANTNINQESLKSLTCYFPSKSEQDDIVTKLNIIDNKIQESGNIVGKLQKMKSGLMQDLLTGKVRVAA